MPGRNRGKAAPQGSCRKPVRGSVDQIGWNHMAARELAVVHIIARTGQLPGKPSAATLNRQNLVLVAVANEDPGLASGLSGRGKARGEGQDMPEELAVGETDRESIGSPVGEPSDSHVARVIRPL